MTDIRKKNQKSKERLDNGIRSTHPDKCIRNNANVLHPNFGGQLKRRDTSASRNLAQLGEPTTSLLQQKGEPSEQEEESRSQVGTDLGQEDGTDLKDE